MILYSNKYFFFPQEKIFLELYAKEGGKYLKWKPGIFYVDYSNKISTSATIRINVTVGVWPKIHWSLGRDSSWLQWALD